MPEFELTVPIVGNSWAVGLAFQIHIAFVAFIMGIAMLAPAAQLLALRRRDERWDRLAHTLATTVGRLFSWGATWAVVALVLLFGLFPRLFGVLTAIFFSPLVVVVVLWFIMTISAYSYYHTWERFRRQPRTHMAIGWTFAVSAFLFISLITFLSSYMLTPSEPRPLLAAILNPTWAVENIHRHIGNLSYAGLLLASYAGLRILFFPAGAGEDRAYYAWVARLGLVLGLGLALLQPIGGWFYAFQIQRAVPAAFHAMMVGERAWLWLVQSFFYAAVIFFGNLYFTLSTQHSNPSSRATIWMRRSLWALAALGLLLIVPKELPLGQMKPWKYIALAGLVLLSAVNLRLFLKTPRRLARDVVGAGSRLSLILVGVAVIALLITMGIIRSTARGPFLIYDRLPPALSQEIEPPQR
jgi:cytochrome bd-type quinol oxidase subunit 1